MEQKYIASRFDKTSSAVKVAPQPEPEPEPAPPTTNIDGLLTKAGRDEIEESS